MRRLLFVVFAQLCACASETEPVEANTEALATPAPTTLSYGPSVLDLYQPANRTDAKRPLMVWIHGGAFAYGTRRDPHLVRLAQHTASLGYVSVSIDYTLTNAGFDEEKPFPYPARSIRAANNDARAAILYLRTHADDLGIDANRIAIGGASAGAITAIAVAYGERDASIRAVVDLWGAMESPTKIAPGDPPLLILHGTADQHWMPFAQAEHLRDRARAAGVPCTFVPLPGKNHGPWDELEDYLKQITPFLRRNLAAANTD